jgi:hypothetical protein
VVVVVRREDEEEQHAAVVSSHTPQTRGGAGPLPALATLSGRNEGGDAYVELVTAHHDSLATRTRLYFFLIGRQAVVNPNTLLRFLDRRDEMHLQANDDRHYLKPNCENPVLTCSPPLPSSQC